MTIFLYIVGILLILINSIPYIKGKNGFKSILRKNEDNISAEQLSIVNMRKEFAETVLELQQEIEAIKSKLSDKDSPDEEEGNDEDEENDDAIEEKSEASAEDTNNAKGNNSSVRVDEIGKLLKAGLSIEEICEKLDVGKGEVLLIKELYLK